MQTFRVSSPVRVPTVYGWFSWDPAALLTRGEPASIAITGPRMLHRVCGALSAARVRSDQSYIPIQVPNSTLVAPLDKDFWLTLLMGANSTKTVYCLILNDDAPTWLTPFLHDLSTSS